MFALTTELSSFETQGMSQILIFQINLERNAVIQEFNFLKQMTAQV